MARRATPVAVVCVAAAGCGGKKDSRTAATSARPSSSLYVLSSKSGFTTSRVGDVLDVSAVALGVRGKEPAVVELVGLEGTSAGLGRLGASAVPGGTPGDANVIGPIGTAWPPRAKGARPVEGLRVDPGGTDVNGRPAAGEERINEPWTLHYGFRVMRPGALRYGTAVIAYRQSGRRRITRVPLDFTMCARRASGAKVRCG